MIAGRLRWRPKKGGQPIKVPPKRGLAAFDFDAGCVLFTEEGTKKRASLHLRHSAGRRPARRNRQERPRGRQRDRLSRGPQSGRRGPRPQEQRRRRAARRARQALREIEEALADAGIEPEGWLIQKMAASGHEVIFGLSTDDRFGPLLMFGLGGKYVEVFRDVRFGVAPLSVADARDMIRGVRGFKLLEGVRGEAPADLDLLEEILLRLAQLVARHPRIQELDINPFLAAPKRGDCMALDVRMGGLTPDPVSASQALSPSKLS